MSKTVEFKAIKVGGTFRSTCCNEFVKVSESGAKRTEAHWADSDKFWPFSPINKVLVAAH